MKCIGASMCVPLCAPIEYTDSVSLSPFRMSFRKSNFMGASPAYTGVVAGSSVAVTSIHPAPPSSLVPGSQGTRELRGAGGVDVTATLDLATTPVRSEEHTSELQ